MRDIRRWIAILLLALPACDQLPSDPELPQLANILRHWRFSTYQLDTDSVTEGDWHTQLAGVVSDLEDYVGDKVVNGHCDCMFHINTFQWPWTYVASLVVHRTLRRRARSRWGCFRPQPEQWASADQIRCRAAELAW